MRSFSENSGAVKPVRADSLSRRKMDVQKRLSFGGGLRDGTIALSHFSREQVCFLLPGLTKTELYRAARARANGGGGDHAENGNGADANSPPAALAADLIRTVGIAEAIDLLVRINSEHNGG